MNTLLTPRRITYRDPFLTAAAFFRQDPFLTAIRESYKTVEIAKENENTTLITYNLAGFQAENIKTQFNTLTGVLTVHAEQDTKTYNHRMPLPAYTEPDDINVTYKDGLLSIRVTDTFEKREKESVVDIPLQ